MANEINSGGSSNADLDWKRRLARLALCGRGRLEVGSEVTLELAGSNHGDGTTDDRANRNGAETATVGRSGGIITLLSESNKAATEEP